MGGSGEFKGCFPEEVVFKLRKQSCSTGICGFDALACPSQEQPWTRESMGMVLWEPQRSKEPCHLGALFKVGSLFHRRSVVYQLGLCGC